MATDGKVIVSASLYLEESPEFKCAFGSEAAFTWGDSIIAAWGGTERMLRDVLDLDGNRARRILREDSSRDGSIAFALYDGVQQACEECLGVEPAAIERAARRALEDLASGEYGSQISVLHTYPWMEIVGEGSKDFPDDLPVIRELCETASVRGSRVTLAYRTDTKYGRRLAAWLAAKWREETGLRLPRGSSWEAVRAAAALAGIDVGNPVGGNLREELEDLLSAVADRTVEDLKELVEQRSRRGPDCYRHIMRMLRETDEAHHLLLKYGVSL